jgi:hypothetical protein
MQYVVNCEEIYMAVFHFTIQKCTVHVLFLVQLEHSTQLELMKTRIKQC